MPPEVRVEHRYPQALGFLRRHGAQAVAVLHDLLAHAERVDGRLVVTASSRDIAARLEFVSKDTVNRHLRRLRRAGVVELLPAAPIAGGGVFRAPTYRLHLDGTGITVTTDDSAFPTPPITCRTTRGPLSA